VLTESPIAEMPGVPSSVFAEGLRVFSEEFEHI
jgi:hypothetical protein